MIPNRIQFSLTHPPSAPNTILTMYRAATMAKDQTSTWCWWWWWRVSTLLQLFSQFVFLLHSPSPEHIKRTDRAHPVWTPHHTTLIQHIPNRWRWVESAARIVHKHVAFESFYYFSVIHYVFPWMVASRSALQLKALF